MYQNQNQKPYYDDEDNKIRSVNGTIVLLVFGSIVTIIGILVGLSYLVFGG